MQAPAISSSGPRIARSAADGCTPERTGEANPDAAVQRGFVRAAAEVEEAIHVIEVARGTRPPSPWWEPRDEAVNIVNALSCCPSNSDLDSMIPRLREMRARLIARFPYRCAVPCPGAELLDRGLLASSNPQDLNGAPGPPLCRPDFGSRSRGGVSGLLTIVAARLAGLPIRRNLCAPSDGTRYVLLADPSFRAMSRANATACGPGHGLQAPPPEPEAAAEPSRAPDRSTPATTVYVDDPARPTSWSFTMRFPVPADSRHDPGRPPDFIRLAGRLFDLCPGGQVRERTLPSACPAAATPGR